MLWKGGAEYEGARFKASEETPVPTHGIGRPVDVPEIYLIYLVEGARKMKSAKKTITIFAAVLLFAAAAGVCYATDYIAYADSLFGFAAIINQSDGATVKNYMEYPQAMGGVAFDRSGNLYTNGFSDFAGGTSVINKWVKSGTEAAPDWTKVTPAPYISSPEDSMPLYGIVVGADGLLYANRNWSYLDIYDVDNVPDVPTLVGDYDSGAFLNSRDIACGPDGSVWIAGCNCVDATGPEVARWDPITHAFTFYAAPSYWYMNLTFGPDADGDRWSDVYVSGENSIIMYSGRTGASLGNYLTGLPDTLTQCDLAFSADGGTLYYMVNGSNVGGTCAIKAYDVGAGTTTTLYTCGLAWGQMSLSNPYMPTVPEPSGVVAMLGGLMGLVSFGIRRKK